MANANDHADVKILPPALMAIFLAIAFGLNWLFPVALPRPDLFRIAGWGLLVVGVGLGFGALLELSRANTSPIPHEPTTAVVTRGVYSFTRNPIYLGFVLTVIGLPLAFGNPWGFILLPLLIAAFNELVIKQEEAYLASKFGSLYSGYTSRVRRWV